MHDSAGEDLVSTDDRHIVFRLTGDHAGLTADARIEIDRHGPGTPWISESGIERLRFLISFKRAWVGIEFFEPRLPHKIAPHHAVAGLCRREPMCLTGFVHGNGLRIP